MTATEQAGGIAAGLKEVCLQPSCAFLRGPTCWITNATPLTKGYQNYERVYLESVSREEPMSASHDASTTNAQPAVRGWSIGIWVAQGLLAIAFGMAGVMKTFTPIDELAQKLPWASSAPSLLVRFIGVSELAGALGLILAAATRLWPMLTPIAALGLMVIMVLAAGFHILRGEGQAVPINAVLGGLAALIAWGRLHKAPLDPRR